MYIAAVERAISLTCGVGPEADHLRACAMKISRGARRLVPANPGQAPSTLQASGDMSPEQSPLRDFLKPWCTDPGTNVRAGIPVGPTYDAVNDVRPQCAFVLT